MPANIISTATAFCFSFFANKKYTFRESGGGSIKKQIPLFIVVTLTGLWGVQTIVITIATPLISSFGLGGGITLVLAKVIATMASLVWNYIFYSRIVFKTSDDNRPQDE